MSIGIPAWFFGVMGLAMVPGTVRAGDPPVTRQFCTSVGGVFLEFRGRQVVGTYQILTPNKRINGTIEGRWENHLVVGRWQDPDGEGQILIFFHKQKDSVSMLYNSDADPEHWYPVWRGVSKTALSEATEAWICEKQPLQGGTEE